MSRSNSVLTFSLNPAQIQVYMSFTAEHRAKTYIFPTFTTIQNSVGSSLEACALSFPQTTASLADMSYFSFHAKGSGIKKEQLLLQRHLLPKYNEIQIIFAEGNANFEVCV